jgi:hypothetical protein
MIKKMKVRDLPAHMAIEYFIKDSLKSANLDGIELEVHGDTVTLPWGEKYRPKKGGYMTISLGGDAFYEEKKWDRTEKEWAYIETHTTSEKFRGGLLKKEWEVRYVVLPPFPEVPPFRKTEWREWRIHGEYWDEKGVVFTSEDYSVTIPILFQELETSRELEFLSEHEVYFCDRDTDSAYVSKSHYDFFFERISYLADLLGVPDPGIEKIRSRQEEEAAAEAKKLVKKAAMEKKTEISYKLTKLTHSGNDVSFEIRGGKVYRLYGENSVLLKETLVPIDEIKVNVSRKEAEKKIEHRVELGGGYSAIYKRVE